MTDCKSIITTFAAITLALSAAHGLTTTAANAAVYTWADAGTDWNAASNWGGTQPGPLDVSQFNSPSYNFQPVLSVSNTVGAVWDSGSGSLAIQGGALGLLGATVNGTSGVGLQVDAGGGGFTISSSLLPLNPQTWTNNSAVTMNILGNVNNVGHTITVAGSGNMLISGTISNSGGLTKTGPSVLTLTATNPYSGPTLVSAGTLQIGNGGSSGNIASTSFVNIQAGATLLYSKTNSQNLANDFFGAGTWTLGGVPSTVFTITGSAIGFTGMLNVNAGVLSASGTGTGLRVPSSSATINVASGAEFFLNGGTCNSSITLNGSGPPNGGALTFMGSTVYAGNITLAGNAQLTSSANAKIPGNIGGPFQLSFYAPSFVFPIQLSGSNSYGSTLFSGSSTEVILLNPNALSPGPLAFSAGGFLVANGNSFSVASLSGSAGQIQNGGLIPATVTVGSDGSSTTFGGRLIDGSTASLALTKAGSGTLTLGGTSAFSGATTLANGTLLLANTAGSALGSSTLTINSGELASAAGAAGSMSGPVLAGSGPHIISPGGEGPIGSLGVGGLSINALTTVRFDIANSSSLDQIDDAGSLAFSGTGAASVLVPDSLPLGLYKLMSYASTSSINSSDLSLGIIGGGSVPATYELQLNPNELDLAVVPEPSTLALFAIGAAGLAAIARRKRNHA